jgi:hypothetical protein
MGRLAIGGRTELDGRAIARELAILGRVSEVSIVTTFSALYTVSTRRHIAHRLGRRGSLP